MDAQDLGAVDVAVEASGDVAEPAEYIADDVSYPPFEESETRVLLDLTARPVHHPFPANYYLGEQGEVVFDSKLGSSSLLLYVSTNAVYRSMWKETKGYATYSPIVFLSSKPVDPASLPQTSAESVAPGSSVQLRHIAATGMGTATVLGDPVAVYASTETVVGFDGTPRYVTSLLPVRPLPPGETYALVVRDKLRASDGATFGMARGFAELVGRASPVDHDGDTRARIAAEKPRLTPIYEALAVEADASDDLPSPVVVTDFYVGTDASETEELLLSFRKGGAYQEIWHSLDGDGDGTDDFFYGADFPDCSMDEGMGAAVYGRFKPINFTGPDDEFVRAAGGGFEEFESEEVEFWLMVPSLGPGADAPAPVVILQHGIDDTHRGVCKSARLLIDAGIAVLRFDWPRHGKRGSGGFEFLDISNPLKIRDNFRQSYVDLASAVMLVEQLAASLDLLPSGAPDGVADLDGARIGYMGASLGSILGFGYLPFSDRISCIAGTVGGVGLFHMVDVAITDKLAGFDQATLKGFGYGAEHMIAPGDGVAFVDRLLTNTIPGTMEERYLLMIEVIDDGTVPNESTEILARAAGLPVIAPAVEPIPDTELLAPSETRSGIIQYADQTHWFFEGSTSDPDTVRARAQIQHYMRTCLFDGVPAIKLD